MAADLGIARELQAALIPRHYPVFSARSSPGRSAIQFCHRHGHEACLEQAGFEVRVAHDGEECLRMAMEDVPDLLLLDIMMPKMDGIDVLKRLRADDRTRGLSVVMCSAKDFKTEREVAAEFGAAGYFVNSSNPDELVVMVRDVFGLQHG